MNKDEFLKELDQKIDVLEKDEREKIIKKYKTQITKRLNKGENEEEVIASYDIDKEVSSILDEHGVSDNKTTKSSSKGFFGDLIDTVEGLVDSVSKKSAKEIFFMLLEIVLIILLVALFKIPFEFIKEILISLFSALGGTLANTFMYITNLIVEIVYFVFAVIVFIVIFKKRFEKYKKTK